jgi:SAM-dependent methyltransferase
VTIESHLQESFGHAAHDHFVWQTEHPYVSERERELVRSAFLPLGSRVLDVGCGEGATLFHLGEPKGVTGIDLFEEKIRYARTRFPACRFVVGSAYDLPFEEEAFDHIIVRDVIHHLERPERFIAECARVLAADGKIDSLETCRNNPLIMAHGLAVPVERGQLRSTMSYVRGLLDENFKIVSTDHWQALPIHRLVFHPDLGLPALANRPAVRALVQTIEDVAARVVPRTFWAYLHVRAIKTR